MDDRDEVGVAVVGGHAAVAVHVRVGRAGKEGGQVQGGVLRGMTTKQVRHNVVLLFLGLLSPQEGVCYQAELAGDTMANFTIISQASRGQEVPLR